MEAHDLREVGVREGVAAYDQEALALEVELLLGHLDRSRGACRGVLYRVTHVHAPVGAVAEVVLYLLGHELEGDHDVREAVAREQVNDVLHARQVDYPDHRFGLVARERPQPGPLPAGHYYRLHLKPHPCL